MKKDSRVSLEARARISAAQRERWKKYRESKGAVQTVATMTEAPRLQPSIYLEELNQEVIMAGQRRRFDCEFIHNLLRDALLLMKGGNPSASTLVEAALAALKHVQSTTTKAGE
jgi:hypothetical protein